jgi:hypothetical protein
MITCKSVSRTLAKDDYEKLPPLRKKLLRLHVRLCCICGHYNGFVMTMQDTARAYREREETLVCPERLPPELAGRIKAAARDSLPGG